MCVWCLSCACGLRWGGVLVPVLPIRLVDITELDLPSNIKTIFPDPADILNFELTIDPDEGQYLIPSALALMLIMSLVPLLSPSR